MRLTFRAKLAGLVGITALAFLLIIVAEDLITRRVEQQLATLQQRYLPKVDLEPKLSADLERIQRGFQDAVAGRDSELLASTAELRDAFLRQLEGARAAVDPQEAAELRQSTEDYYAAGHDVSRRLIAGETGVAVVEAMREMQAKQARTSALLKKTAALDRQDLTDAFAEVDRAEAEAKSYRIAISVVCLATVLLLAAGIGRSLVRSLRDLMVGLMRFGSGDFSQPIQVRGQDELGDVAQHANQMAASLDRSLAEQKRTALELQGSNRELEAFSYSVAHDLRAPLRGINGFGLALLEDYEDKLDATGKDYLRRISEGATRMGQLIDALLGLARVTRKELRRESVNLSQQADAVVKQLAAADPERSVEFVNQPNVLADGDSQLLRALLENLLGNSWKFTGARTGGRIDFGSYAQNGLTVYYVRDNGAGFDMTYASKLFTPFQRLHSAAEFAGTGIGLATVQRIVNRHGGRIWAEGHVNQGASFFFTLAAPATGALT
jgi:signal transduction histidine kinase